MITVVAYPMKRAIWFGLIIGVLLLCAILGHPERVHFSADASSEVLDGTEGPWDQWRGSIEHLGTSEGSIPSEGRLRWEVRTADQVQSSPVFHNGSVIMRSDDGKLYAVEAETSLVQWKFTTGGAIQGTPLILEERLYFGSSDGIFYCLPIPGPDEAITEPVEVWTFSCGSPIVSSAHAFNGTLLFGCQDGFFYKLSMDGEFVWKTEIGWEIWATPLIDPDNGRAFIGATNGNFSCLDLVEEKKVWTINIGEVYSSGCLWNDTVYIGSGQDHEFLAIDPDNGSIIWTFDTELPVFSTPSYHMARLYFTSYERVWCLPATDPNGDGVINATEMIWSTSINDREGGSSPLIAGGLLYVGSDDGDLYCLETGSGEVLWNFTTRGYVYSSPALYNGSIFFGSCDNSIYCIGNRLIGLNVMIGMELEEMNSDQSQVLTISVTDQNGTLVEGAAVTVSLSAGAVEAMNGETVGDRGRFITGPDGRITVRFQPPKVSSRSTIEVGVKAETQGMRPGEATARIILEPGSDGDQDSPAANVSDRQEKRVPYYLMLSLFIIIDVVLAVIIMGTRNPRDSGKKQKEDGEHASN